MTIFTIDMDNNITAFASDEQVQANIPPSGYDAIFSTEKEFAKLSSDWPATRLVEIWNSFAGQVPFDALQPVKKFKDRTTAVSRIWKAVQALTPTVAPQEAPVAPKKAKAAKESKSQQAAPTAAAAREGSKKSIVLEMLKRPDGATLADLMAATGWQAHSLRGFISGALGKKMGIAVESVKTPEGGRAYRIAL